MTPIRYALKRVRNRMRWIMARLRHHPFTSVHEVNQAIAPLLTRLNEKPFQKLPGSRASTFAALDAPALLPLPLQRYEMANFKTVKAHIDYHVEVERHRYSVPHALVGQVLEARITTAVVEIMHRGQRVVSHARNSRQGGFTTIAAHMPAAHRAHISFPPQRLTHWGQSIGPATAEAVTRLMAENRHPEHGYRACLGLLSLAKRYGKPRLESACTLALRIGACQYRHVRDILTNNRDQSTPTCVALTTTNKEFEDDDAYHPGATAYLETGWPGNGPGRTTGPARHGRVELRGAAWHCSSIGKSTAATTASCYACSRTRT